jgi:hypothetical protein
MVSVGLIMVRFSELAGTRIKRLANARHPISGGILGVSSLSASINALMRFSTKYAVSGMPHWTVMQFRQT